VKKLFKYILNTIPRPLLIKMSYWIRPIVTFVLKGTKFTDPIDGKSFRTFLSYGYAINRDNALSPSTLSLERHRLLWLYFLDYTTTDLLSPLADVKADICNLPFENHSFDTILCNHVLEHIPDDTKAMKELFRILKPGGMAILQIPQDLERAVTFEDDTITDEKERTKIFGQYDHVRVYGRDYFDKLRSIGFTVNEVDYTAKFTPEELEKYCLMEGEIIPVCFK